MKTILLFLVVALLTAAGLRLSADAPVMQGQTDVGARAILADGHESLDAAKRSTADSIGAPTELPPASLYHVDSEWTDQRGLSVRWPDLQGRPRLVALFFTQCGFACPRIVHDLKSILGALPEEDRQNAGVVLVSIDPEQDTPEALQRFSTTHGLPSPQWTLLRGEDTEVRELAAVLGTRYRRLSDGEFAHSNAIILLDERGEVIARRDGSDGGRDEIISALSR